MRAPAQNVVRAGDLELRFLVDEMQGKGQLVMFELIVPDRARVPVPHYHREVDEAIFGLKGILTTMIDGRKHEISAGDTVFIPRGSVHHHQNLHPVTARALTVLTPGIIGRRYFEEMAEVINAPGKPDAPKLKEIMLRHGLVPAEAPDTR